MLEPTQMKYRSLALPHTFDLTVKGNQRPVHLTRVNYKRINSITMTPCYRKKEKKKKLKILNFIVKNIW
jgi:hypothetical protein